MPNAYSYTPQNLVLARTVLVHSETLITSVILDMTWPKNGYVEASCSFPNKWFTPSRKQIPHDNARCDLCGIYGQFDLNLGRYINGSSVITILIETHGKVIIGDRLIARTQAAQVIAIVERKEKITTTPQEAEWNHAFANLDKIKPTFAQQYFDVPIISRTEAQQLIDQQVDVWELSEMIADTRKQQDEKFLKAYIKAAKALLQVSKTMKETERSMVDFKAAITTNKPNKAKGTFIIHDELKSITSQDFEKWLNDDIDPSIDQ